MPIYPCLFFAELGEAATIESGALKKDVIILKAAGYQNFIVKVCY
jgi:hypothetical protein